MSWPRYQIESLQELLDELRGMEEPETYVEVAIQKRVDALRAYTKALEQELEAIDTSEWGTSAGMKDVRRAEYGIKDGDMGEGRR